MKNLYQTHWHDIPFSSFSELSSTKIAGAAFYDAFYLELFKKYADYESLDFNWRQSKDEIADWISSSLSEGNQVLSVGCGLGYLEQRLWRKHGDRIELHVSDYASESLRWLRQVMPADRIHNAESIQSHKERYNLVFLSGVDYALSNKNLVALLAGLRDSLCKDGEVMITSQSFLKNETLKDKIVEFVKSAAKRMLIFLGLRHAEKRGQLWGFMRSRSEYQATMRAAGFSNIVDGFMETKNQRTYWIKGGVISKG